MEHYAEVPGRSHRESPSQSHPCSSRYTNATPKRQRYQYVIQSDCLLPIRMGTSVCNVTETKTETLKLKLTATYSDISLPESENWFITTVAPPTSYIQSWWYMWYSYVRMHTHTHTTLRGRATTDRVFNFTLPKRIYLHTYIYLRVKFDYIATSISVRIHISRWNSSISANYYYFNFFFLTRRTVLPQREHSVFLEQNERT